MEIVKVVSKKDLMRFINFPHQLYKDDENYVPELNLVVKRMLSNKNPFLKHSEIALFLAVESGIVMGRIAAVYNKTHLETYKDNTGFFGFFDSINDVSVAKRLFETCEQWLTNKGITKIIGPTNLTTNDSCGILIDGFQFPPMVMMPYNKEYYGHLCEESGFEKSMDLNSYNVNAGMSLERYNNIYFRSLDVMKTNNIRIRNISSKTFQRDIERLQFVYNKANENNWGFMPLNREEFKAMAADLKTTTPLDFTFIVEKDNNIISFLIAVPNLNQVFKHIKNGKLFPFGIFKFLMKKNSVDSARIMILGILDEYRGMGIDLALYRHLKEKIGRAHV
jgi:ribosomal protein S18 acetylase RimI-like enzyme